ncbi:MAG: DUF3592 domain-containing protein, partial [bacterium]|nr:DUF3592 domain-containing protein [bacterium]
MKQDKYKRNFFIACSILFIIQMLWLFFFYRDMNKNYIKTKATVIEVTRGDRSHPIYEFIDVNGRPVVIDRYYENQCGVVNLPCQLLQNDKGDKITVYYKASEPDKATLLTGNILTF